MVAAAARANLITTPSNDDARFAELERELAEFRAQQAAQTERALAVVSAAARAGPLSDAIDAYASKAAEASDPAGLASARASADADAEKAIIQTAATRFREGYCDAMANTSLHPLHRFVQDLAETSAARASALAERDAKITAYETELGQARASQAVHQRSAERLGRLLPPAVGSKRGAAEANMEYAASSAEGGGGDPAGARAAKRARASAGPATLVTYFDEFMQASTSDTYSANPTLTPSMMKFRFFTGPGR